MGANCTTEFPESHAGCLPRLAEPGTKQDHSHRDLAIKAILKIIIPTRYELRGGREYSEERAFGHQMKERQFHLESEPLEERVFGFSSHR